MSRFAPYLGIIAALFVGVFVMAISSNVPTFTTQAPLIIPNASSTISVLPDIVLSPTVVPPAEPKAVGVTTSVQEQPAKIVSSPVKEVATSALPPRSPSENVALLDASASALRSALVNIICYAPAGSKLRSISGSGVIVDPKGIILTNAHIAQNFLLEDRNVSCTIRAGSPAVDTYEASLIYIPSEWIKANAKLLTETNPKGTGEYDFAFLAMSSSATSAELPSSFPFVPLATLPPHIGTAVVIASYGAQFLESSQIRSALFPTVVFGSVKNVFTFAATTIDVLALGGSAAAQEGSSGGGVADIKGELVGTITTSTTKGATETRALDAITASYIRAAYASETGQALDLLLAQSPATSIANFAPKMPDLESILTANL